MSDRFEKSSFLFISFLLFYCCADTSELYTVVYGASFVLVVQSSLVLFYMWWLEVFENALMNVVWLIFVGLLLVVSEVIIHTFIVELKPALVKLLFLMFLLFGVYCFILVR